MSEEAGKTILMFTWLCAIYSSLMVLPWLVHRQGALSREASVKPLCVSAVVVDKVFISDAVHGVDLGLGQLLVLGIEEPIWWVVACLNAFGPGVQARFLLVAEVISHKWLMSIVGLDFAALAGPVVCIPDTAIYPLRLVFGEWNTLVFVILEYSDYITIYWPPTQ